MAASEEEARLAGGESGRPRLLVGGGVALTVGLAVAVEFDAPIGLIDDRQVDQGTGVRGLGRTVDVLGADAVVAAGHPLGWLPFAEDDRIEDPAADGLDRDDAAAALREGGEGDPGFERLGREGRGGRAGLGEGILAIENQASVADDGGAVEFRVEPTDEVAAVLFEGPPVARRRAGVLVGLEATPEIIAGEAAFDFRQFILQADAFLRTGADAFKGGRQFLGLLSPLSREFGADGLLEFGQAGAVSVEQGGGVHGHLARAGGGEDAVEGGEVGLADGVEFMVVAAGAGHRETEEGLADDIDLVVHVADLLVDGVDRLEAMFDHAEVAGAEGGFVQPLCRVDAGGRQEVAGELLADKLVVGDIGVEGADQVIAIAPRLRDGGVAFAAVGVGVADEVHPVAGEVFAVTRRSQQPVDHLRVGLR